MGCGIKVRIDIVVVGGVIVVVDDDDENEDCCWIDHAVVTGPPVPIVVGLKRGGQRWNNW